MRARLSSAILPIAVTFATACSLDDLAMRDGGSGAPPKLTDGSVGDTDTREPGTTWTKSAPSCADGLQCGGASCCESRLVHGGTFPMGRGDGGADHCAQAECFKDEQPEHEATIGDFYLDTYEVTVARFRKYVNEYQKPKEGDGAHPKVTGSGWQTSWNYLAAESGTELATWLGKGNDESTWTPSPGPNENKPMNQITWFELFAFCAWDGGRLPTEAEWEYAAAGGSENRMYPWGPREPTADLAAFDIGVFGVVGLPTVGSKTGRSRWLQHDLAGSLFEWTLDAIEDYSASACTDCVRFAWSSSNARAYRGGFYGSEAVALRSANRGGDIPTHRLREVGGRCARD